MFISPKNQKKSEFFLKKYFKFVKKYFQFLGVIIYFQEKNWTVKMWKNLAKTNLMWEIYYKYLK